MTIMQVLRRTAAEWTTHNPSLSRDTIGIESDTSKSKIGDGSTSWNSLPYFTGAGDGGGATSFAELTDAPATLVPLAPVTASQDGLSLVSPDWITFDPQYHGVDVHPSDPEDGNGTYLAANSTTGSFRNAQIGINDTQAIVGVQAGNNANFSIVAEGSSTKLWVLSGQLLAVGLPTSDPEVAGALWNDTGTLKISAG